MCFVSQASDPLGQDLGLSVADYKWATRQIMQAAAKCPSCRGRLVSVLEGGYDVAGQTVAESGLAHCAKAHVLALMGEPPPPREHKVVKREDDDDDEDDQPRLV